ncbi:MAG: pitrilysin family protein, partial [Candidatus Caenarcaniphilales bacterium]|nr:pitrilysin family protein [Candidatus Caenarcaniphilales bacterium]
MRNSIINPTEAEREKQVVLSELLGGENNPRTLLSREIMKNTFPSHPYGIPIIGWKEDVLRIQSKDLESYYNTYYQPNNAVLILVGDINSDEAIKKIKNYFGAIPASQKTIPPLTAFTHQSAPKKEVLVKSPSETLMLSLNWDGVNFTHKDYAALAVLSAILTNGDLSRLEKSLVDTGEVSYIESSMRKGIDPFNFSIFAATAKTGNLEKVQQKILEEVSKIREKGVSEEELERVKAKSETSFLFGIEEPESLASQLGFFELVAGDWKKTFEWAKEIQAVTTKQIKEVANKYLSEDKLFVGKLIDDPNHKGPKYAGPAMDSEVANYKPESKTNLSGLYKNSAQSPTAAKATNKKGVVSEKIVMPNGLTIVLRENPSLPILAIAGTVDAGEVFDNNFGLYGASTLTAIMANRGSKDMSRDQLNFAMESIGAEAEINPEKDFISISAKARAKDYDSLLKLISQQIRYPIFPEDELKKLKLQMLSELNQSRDDLKTLGKIAIYSSIYPKGHPYHEPSIEEQIKAVEVIKVDDLKRFHSSYYQPSRVILSISGDFKKKDILASINKYFADWKTSKQDGEKFAVPQAVNPSKADTDKIIEVPGKSQALVILGQAGEVTRDHPDFYPLLVANDILGGGSTLASRLGKRVREEAGLVYSISSFYSMSRGAGPFLIQMGVPPEKVEQAIKLTKEEVSKFQNGEITDEELERAKSYRSGFFVSNNLTSNENVASSLNQYALWKMDLDTINLYPEKIKAVTKDDVVRVIKKYITPEKLQVVIVKPN